MTFAFIDIVFFVIILVMAISIAIKGFFDELLGKCAVILGIFSAIIFYGNLTSYILPYIKNEILSAIISFILIFIVVYIVISLIKIFVGKLFQNKLLGGLDKSLGFFLGIVEGLLIVAVIMIILELQPFFQIDGIFKNSIFYEFLKTFLVEPEKMITQNINIAMISNIFKGSVNV